MSDPLSIFWKRLQTSQLLAPSKYEQLRAAASADELSGTDVKGLAKRLIADGILTRHQAKSLLSGGRIPLVFGEYVVLDDMPEAPFHDAFRVRHVPTGHELAAIVHRKDLKTRLKDPEQVARIQQRLVADRSVRQAQVIRAYELVENGDYAALIIDPAEGKLLSVRHPAERLDPTVASSIALQVASALTAWHDAGRVHGDVRPETIVVAADGSASLWRDPLYEPVPLMSADAATLSELQDRAPYLAPELDVQQAPYSPLTDLYALGAVYFGMLSGEVPFRRDSLAATMQAHASERIAPLEPLGVPKPIEQIVTYLMAKRPDVRYQRAADAAAQIARFAGLEGAGPSPPLEEPAAVAFQAWLDRRGTPKRSSAADVAAPNAAATPSIGMPSSNPGIAGIASEAAGSSHNSPLRLIEARKKARRRQRLIAGIVVGLLLVGSLGAAAVYFVGPMIAGRSKPTNDQEVADDGKADPAETDSEPNATVESDAAVPQSVVADDGQLLWESPTQGRPLTLVGLPARPRLILVARTSALLAGDGAATLLSALGPDFRDRFDALNRVIGIDADRIGRQVVALYDPAGTSPNYRPFLQIEFEPPVPLETLTEAWGEAGFEIDAGAPYRRGGEAIGVIASDLDGGVRTIGLGPVELVEEAIAANGEPELAPNLKLLLTVCDADRHLTLIGEGTMLFGPEGKAAIGPFWAPLLDSFEPVLRNGVRAFAVSAHRDGGWYLELDAARDLSTTSERLVEQWSDGGSEWGMQLEAAIAEVPQHPYWERVRLRFPSWSRQAIGAMRFGVEGPFAKANLWLPEPAVPNLVAGTELILASLSADTVTTVVEPPLAEALPADLDELLAAKVDFAVTSDDMINVMNQLQLSVEQRYPGLSFPFAIRLVGKDLGTEGITQNQRISNFSVSDTPLSDVLTQLVVKANPDKASTSPRDDKQKLLWIVGPHPDKPDTMAVLITTRAAAVRDKRELPEPFRPE